MNSMTLASVISGAKCDIQRNSSIIATRKHGLQLCGCLDPYGEWDWNPINFTDILKIKHILDMIVCLCLNINGWFLV
jgi:hypothetical protein